MSIRRMMMLQQSKPDLLEGYRFNNPNNAYRIGITWLDNNTIQISKTVNTFGGSSSAGKAFIGSNKSSSSYAYCFSNTAMKTLELGKTLTVIEVAQNTATAENDGTLTLVIGRQSYYGTIGKIKYSDIKVGAKIEAFNTYSNNYNCISDAVLGFDTPTIMWDFKIKVDFEEV